MTKLKLIKKITSDWFESHAFVNEVYWGDFIRWYADKEIEHSCVVITPVRVTEVTRSKRAIQLQITYADRVFGDFRNLDDVHSDADRVLADFILSASNDKEIRKYLTGLTNGNIEYFTNRTGDLVAGATMSVSLNVFSDANSCEIPVDFKPQPTPFECEDVVIVVNSTNLGTVASGDTLEVSTVDTDGNPIVTNNTLTGNDLEIEAPDANYTVQYVNGTLIESGTIPSGGSVTVEVPDIPTCDNATWELRDSNNVLLDSGSIASGGSATITAPDATVNINQSDGTLIASVTAPSGGVEPYNVADSPITVNSEAYIGLKATDSLNITIVDTNGDAVDTTIDGSNVVVDDLPCSVPTDEWVRPADWLTMPSITSGDDKIAMLHAIWDNDSNFVALRCSTTSGDYQVDWGDGTVTKHSSNTVAEHQYNYSTYDPSNSTLSSRGYKQAIIIITPLIGGLTAFTTNIRHSTQNQIYATGYLDVLLSMPNATAGASISFRRTLVENKYMERVILLNTGGQNSSSNMFQNNSSLQSIEYVDASNITDMTLMFSGCSSLKYIVILNTFNVNTMFLMFRSCSSLQSVPLFDTSSVGSMSSMFLGCVSLQSVPLFDTSSVTAMTNTFNNCNSLSKTDIVCVASVSFANNQLSRDGIVNIFNNLLDLTGLTSQNINISGNYGVPDLTTSDLQIATNKNWTITT